jgi:hypothetical protein
MSDVRAIDAEPALRDLIRTQLPLEATPIPLRMAELQLPARDHRDEHGA